MPQTGALRHERRRERAQLRVRATQIATLTLELLHVLFLPRAGLLRGLAVSNEPRAFLVVPRVGGVGVGGCSGAVAVASGAFASEARAESAEETFVTDPPGNRRWFRDASKM